MKRQSMSKCVAERRGAVYVEFLIAFMPVFTLFMCLCELANVYASHLVVKHAAYRAARAGAVVFPDDPANYQGGTSKMDDVRTAGILVLRSKRSIVDGQIEITSGTEYESGQPVVAQVTAQHRCIFPIASRLVCSPFGLNPTKTLTAEATMPAHAARYPYTTQ
jgi:Flp pilus assembly protein TadG